MDSSRSITASDLFDSREKGRRVVSLSLKKNIKSFVKRKLYCKLCVFVSWCTIHRVWLRRTFFSLPWATIVDRWARDLTESRRVRVLRCTAAVLIGSRVESPGTQRINLPSRSQPIDFRSAPPVQYISRAHDTSTCHSHVPRMPAYVYSVVV